MNSIISDNTAIALKQYLRAGLGDLFDEREATNIIAELFRHYLSWTRADLIARQNDKISESELLKFHFALKKLQSGEPLQYITGTSFFYGNYYKVNPSVLIPRPETEELVGRILSTEKRTAPAILDIGTGSGCIAIALKCEKPLARLTALDISQSALDLAKENARQLDADITFIQCDILQDQPVGKFDIIISNPPYISHAEKVEMKTNVLNHEPWIALFVEGDDELLFYRRIIQISKSMLNPGGSLWFEIHEDKRKALEELLQGEHTRESNFFRDMQGKDRMLHIRFE